MYLFGVQYNKVLAMNGFVRMLFVLHFVNTLNRCIAIIIHEFENKAEYCGTSLITVTWTRPILSNNY